MTGTAETISRAWAMPSRDTLTIQPFASLVAKYTHGASVIVDPFARNCMIGTHRNDLAPDTRAQWHMRADQFLAQMAEDGLRADVVIFDPPYSPRQVAECYTDAGIKATMQDTQTAALKRRCREHIARLLRTGGHVLSFGWNTVGMGAGFERVETLLVCHGGDHNDTICVVDRAVQGRLL